MLIKNFLVMVVATMVIIFFECWKWLREGLLTLGSWYGDLAKLLQKVLPSGLLVHRVESLLLLLVLPMLVTLGLALIYYAFKRQVLPAYITITWYVWSLLVVVLALIPSLH